MTRKELTLILIAAGLVLVATSAAFSLYPTSWFTSDSGTASLATPVGSVTAPASSTAVTPDFRAIVQQAGPAVVGVTVAGLRQAAAGDFPLDPNDPFFQFFRGLTGFQFRLPVPGRAEEVPFRSQGSGFIIDSDGLILTNAHVVRDATEVLVKLSDRREFKARVLGVDAQQLQVGDPVLAIGSPIGFEPTDAAVNPGNSGGPLFDASGAVVGINAQIDSRSEGNQGLSFAIPINVALKVKDQIVATGRASQAWLGVCASVALRIQRGGERLFVPVELG